MITLAQYAAKLTKIVEQYPDLGERALVEWYDCKGVYANRGHTSYDYTQFRYGRKLQIAWSEQCETMVEYIEEDIDPDEQLKWEPVNAIALGEMME
jgi:hypothetical protein